jgi:hypothetical protein
MDVVGKPAAPSFVARKYVTRDAEAAKVVKDQRMSARAEREARRAEAVQIAKTAAKNRIARSRMDIVQKVEAAQKQIRNMPPAAIAALLETKSMPDREAILLAEELGANRKELLRRFTPVRRTIREEYLQAVAVPEAEVAEEQTPEQPEVVSQAAQTRRLGRLLGKKSTSEGGKETGNGSQEA